MRSSKLTKEEKGSEAVGQVLARRRIVVRCRIGASLDSAYFEFSDTLG